MLMGVIPAKGEVQILGVWEVSLALLKVLEMSQLVQVEEMDLRPQVVWEV